MTEHLWDKLRRLLSSRKRSYELTFRNVEGEKVLADLARFCRASESTFHPNSDVSRQLDGRREVWLRIQQHLQLSEEELWDLHNHEEKDQ